MAFVDGIPKKLLSTESSRPKNVGYQNYSLAETSPKNWGVETDTMTLNDKRNKK